MGLTKSDNLAEAETKLMSNAEDFQKQGFMVTSIDAIMNWART